MHTNPNWLATTTGLKDGVAKGPLKGVTIRFINPVVPGYQMVTKDKFQAYQAATAAMQAALPKPKDTDIIRLGAHRLPDLEPIVLYLPRHAVNKIKASHAQAKAEEWEARLAYQDKDV